MDNKGLAAIFIISLMISLPAATAFTISSPNAEVTGDSAVITWTTSSDSDSEVQYGKTTAKDQTASSSGLVKDHSITLNNLDEYTKYYYRVVSKDENNTLASYPESAGPDISFITLDVTPPPKVKNLAIGEVTEYSVALSWDHVDVIDFNTYLIYRDGVNTENTTLTEITDSDLLPGMPYEYKVRAVDDSGNLGDFSEVAAVVTIGEDKDAPEISNLAITSLSDNEAVFHWDTNEESDSKITFGESSEPNIEEYQADFVNSHDISISGLQKDHVYYYKASSCDEKANCAETDTESFVAGSDVFPPEINAEIPLYYNRLGLDIDIYTEPLADLKIYVNDVYSRAGRADSLGFIHFEDIILSSALAANSLKIQAEDFAGNQNEAVYSIQMDFEDPVLVIQNNITEAMKQGSFSVQGYVNEECTVEFFTSTVPFDKTPPSKVENLMTGNVYEGEVGITWDNSKDDDVWYYLVYRQDKGLIGIADSNSYSDFTAGPGITYSYWVSAVDRDCFEGESSDALEVKTMDGDYAVSNESDEKIIDECSINEPDAVIETSGSFNQALILGQGINTLLVKATDNAGNSANYTYSGIYDTEPPFFESTNLDEITPSYNQEVKIYGKISEPAKVYVYLNDETAYSAMAESDSNGSFSVDVKLSREKEIEEGAAWENYITLVAQDVAGLNATETARVEYRRCGGGMRLFRVVPEDLVPNELTPRLLLEGMGQITLNLDLEWTGSGEEPYVSDSDVNTLEVNMAQEKNYDSDYVNVYSYELNEEKGHQSIAIVAEINPLEDPTPEGMNWSQYMKEANISKWHNGHCFSNADVMSSGLDSFGAIDGLGCIKIPLEIEITYPQENADGYNNPVTQKECLFVDVVIQPPVNTDKLYNKEMLRGMVDFIDGAINVIDSVLEPMETVTKYVFAGCIAMTAALWIKKTSEFFSCNSILEVLGIDGISACTSCSLESGALSCGDGENGANCESCIGAKLSTLKVERAMHLICDRVTCNSIPSFETYAKDQSDYSFSNEDSSSCAPYEDDVTTEEYSTILEADSGNLGSTLGTNPCDICNIVPDANYCTSHTECCAVQYKRDWDSGALFLDELKESACLGSNDEGIQSQACGGSIGNVFRGVRDFTLCKGENTQDYIEYQLDDMNYLYMLKIDETEKGSRWEILLKTKVYIETTPEQQMTDPEYIYTGPLKTGQQDSSNDYVPPTIGDVKEKLEDLEDYEYFREWNTGLNVIKYTNSKCQAIADGDIQEGNAEWPQFLYPEYEQTYSYDQITGLLTPNPTQLESQPLPSQIVNFICDDYAPQETHILDPKTGFFKAIQAVCLPAITGYLSRTKGILQALRGCFNHILVTGDGSAGYCQQFLSTYVCDLIYYTISCVHKLVPDSGSSEYSHGIAGFGQYMIVSMQEIQRGVENRYGSESSLSAILSGKEVFNSVCMAMFGADIDMNLDTLMDISGADVPIEPFVEISGSTRRFTGINHATGFTTHVYNIFALAVTEQEITYSINLVCSDSYDCDPDEGFENGKCDCVETGEKKRPVSEAMNERLYEGESLNQEYFEEVVGSSSNGPFRYDTVEFEYSYIIGQDGLLGQRGERVTETVRAPIKAIGSIAPSYCFLRAGIAPEFRCTVSTDEGAEARFIQPLAGGNPEDAAREFYLEEKLFDEDKGTDFSFDVEKLEVDDYDNEMPLYVYFNLVNKESDDEEAIKLTEAKITGTGFAHYTKDGDNINFKFKDEWFEKTTDGYSCANEWCITEATSTAAKDSAQMIIASLPDERTSALYLFYVNNNNWELHNTASMSQGGETRIAQCTIEGTKVSCSGTVTNSDSSSDTYGISIDLGTFTDFGENDRFKIEHKEGYESSDCTEQAQDFKLTIGLYNSAAYGNSEDIDMTRPVVYDGQEQEITYNIRARCIPPEPALGTTPPATDTGTNGETEESSGEGTGQEEQQQ